MNNKVVICGAARNIGQFLPYIKENIRKIGIQFSEYAIVIVESDSEDNTVEQLLLWKREEQRLNLKFLGNLRDSISMRTMRIAKARNECISIIEQKYSTWDYMIMIDLDNVSIGEIRGISTCWEYPTDQWDVMTANQEKEYYDIWALRSKTIGCTFDCWLTGILKGMSQQEMQDKLVTPFQKPIPQSGIIEVDSAFGGLGIYKISKILGSRYVGYQEIMGHIFEIAEHVRFHEQLKEKGCRIFINTRMINNT